MILSTTNSIENFNIQKYLGIVCVHEVLGVDFISDFIASITDFTGGRSGTYNSHLDQIYSAAMESLTKQAVAKGANAILGVKTDMDEISGKGKQMFMVSITGTTVVIVPDRYQLYKKLADLKRFRDEELLDDEEYEYEKKKILSSHTNSIQEEAAREKQRFEAEKQAKLQREKAEKEAELRRIEKEQMMQQIEQDKETRKQYRSIIESLQLGEVEAADYDRWIDESLSMFDNCKMLINAGKCAEAAKYYMEMTGLELDDGIDYIKDV